MYLAVKNANFIWFELCLIRYLIFGGNGVQNLKIQILRNAFLVHTFTVVRRYRKNGKPQSIIVYIGSMFISQWVSQDTFDNIILLFRLYPSRPALPVRLKCDMRAVISNSKVSKLYKVGRFSNLQRVGYNVPSSGFWNSCIIWFW